jgi:acyl-CoA thioester hydrolase
VIALTWVENLRRVRSLRRYQFLRQSDNVLLARGETDWVFIDIASGRPRMILEDIISKWEQG